MEKINPMTAYIISVEMARAGLIKRNDPKSEELLGYLFDTPVQEWPEEVSQILTPLLPNQGR